MKLLTLLPLAILGESLFFLYVGLRGLLGKRPFLLHTRWLLGILFVPLVLAGAQMVVSSRQMEALPVPEGGGHLFHFFGLLPLLFGLLLLIVFLALRGYIVYGVTEEAFRDSLRMALDRLGLPYQEMVSRIHLPTIGVDLNATVQARMGTAQLQVKQRGHTALLKQIAGEMKQYFEQDRPPVHMVSAAINTGTGVVFVAMSLGPLSLTSWTNRLMDHAAQARRLARMGSGLPQTTSPWQIPGPAPAARTASQTEPALIGTWTGAFGEERDPALLVVQSQNHRSFEATLVVRNPLGTDRVQIHGSLLPNGGIGLREQKVISARPPGSWALGLDSGALLTDGLTIEGIGVNTRLLSYDWSFRHVSTTPFVPER